MPLNYSKWDSLELSDDSDIEGHPNVDKRSLIRWKQRDIHEKREERNFKIARLEAQIGCNNVLLPRITELTKKLESEGSPNALISVYNSFLDKIQTNPSPECPPGNDATKVEQTYDGMMLSLLRQVGEKAKERVSASGTINSDKEAHLAKEIVVEMQMHVKHLGETIEKDSKELETLIAEKKKHITSEDIHVGVESKYVPPPPAPAPLKSIAPEKRKEKQKATEIEVLNPGSISSSSLPPPKAQESDEDDDDDEDAELPQLTPNLEAFSKLPIGDYEKSFQFIQHHRDVYVPGASDALLVAAFEAQSEGKAKYARKCVHQSLLLQYCEKLGKDGVGVFFKKMVTGDKRALKIFTDDVENTYNHLVTRVKATIEQSRSQKEQIQLVPENPDVVISFNVPDGPPPEQLVLEGEGSEDLDIEEVRKALQLRWDIFNTFSEELQAALISDSLEEVNKVLGNMEVADAEDVVQQLDISGILNFAEGGVRDETGQA